MADMARGILSGKKSKTGREGGREDGMEIQ